MFQARCMGVEGGCRWRIQGMSSHPSTPAFDPALPDFRRVQKVFGDPVSNPNNR